MLKAGFSMVAGATLMLASGHSQEPAVEPMTQTPPTTETPAGVNPDEMASYLNSQQQLKQTYTVTRTINGEVVDTEKRTIVYSPNDPIRPTEAGTSPVEEMKAAFDREVLTRTEAYEEAKLDFTVADVNRDNVVSADEFATLVSSWHEDDGGLALSKDEESTRQQQYRAFIASLDPEGAEIETEAQARAKFAAMAGPAGTLSQDAYIRAHLLDFDAMDANGDMILRGDELMGYRAANRGERLTLSTTP